MQVVVADTGPLNYLMLVGAIDLLPKLFDRIIIPVAVYDELTDAGTPAVVRAWIAQMPSWLEITANPDRSSDNAATAVLDEGECATIALAGAIGADLILMDDRDGVADARAKGFAVTGTLGVLDLAAQRGLSISRRPSRGLRRQASIIVRASSMLCLRNGRRRRNKSAAEGRNRGDAADGSKEDASSVSWQPRRRRRRRLVARP
jgi:predicted nucleic acid-binding protein